MSEETPETRPGTVGDEQLPEDLRPTEDNPLAQPLPDGETADLGKEEAGGLGSGAGDPEGGSESSENADSPDGSGEDGEDEPEGEDAGGHS